MPESAPAIFDRPLPSSVFESLRELLLTTAHDLNKVDQILVDTDLASTTEPGERFALVVSQDFKALLRGTSIEGGLHYQVQLTFDSSVIATFLQGLRVQHPHQHLIPQTVERLLIQPRDSGNSTKLQSTLTLQMLAVIFEPLNVTTLSPTAAACQPMVDAALHQQIQQERLLNQVTTQIRQSLELPVILETAVAQVRSFLQSDRLVIYQLMDAATSESTVAMDAPSHLLEKEYGCITYESRASETIPSALTCQEKFCWSEVHACRIKFSQGITIGVDDIEHNYTSSDCLLNFLRTLEIRAKLITPILVQSQLWGLLIAHQCQPRTWLEHEKNLLQRIGEHLAIAIYQAQLYQELQNQKQTLEHQVSQRTQELHEALVATQAADRIKQDFLATMSHELRTPLTCVIGMSATLLRWSLGPLTEKQRGYLQTIHNSGEQLLELINDILELSQVESGRATLNLQPFSLTSMAQQSVQLLRDQAHTQDVTLKLNLDVPQKRDLFVADPQRVKQILFNLLDNAIKFTPDGGRVVLRVWVEPNTAIFQVEDTGIGISSSQQARLFQKFQQLDTSYRRNYQGAGLGLALAKELVDLHRGWIEVNSVEGKGSIFTVELPYQTLAKDASQSDRSTIGIRPSAGGRIVLLETHEESATLICDMLTAAGYQVIWMVEASTAMEQILFLQPIAVIADLQLFGRDRFQLIQRLRHRPETQHIKVCALLEEAETQSHSDWVPGVDTYLIKPIDPEYLLYKIEALLATDGAEKPVEQPLNSES